jgi:hypothetical protein
MNEEKLKESLSIVIDQFSETSDKGQVIEDIINIIESVIMDECERIKAAEEKIAELEAELEVQLEMAPDCDSCDKMDPDEAYEYVCENPPERGP